MSKDKAREFWIDISDCIEDEDALPVAFIKHPQQGPLLWQSMLIHVIEYSAYAALEAKLAECVAALTDVIAVADRNTNEFNYAREVLARVKK